MDESKIDAIIEICATQPLADQVLPDVGLDQLPITHNEFCLTFAERLARRYLGGYLSFEHADIAANWLFAYSYALDGSPGEMPEFARLVFDAFDGGEFHHQGDSKSINPELKYTKPGLRQLLDMWSETN